MAFYRLIRTGAFCLSQCTFQNTQILYIATNGDQRNILTTVILVGARYFTIRLKFHVGNENIISSINV